MKAWNHEIRVGSDLVVVDRNPEFSDMCNPEGYIWGRRWFVATSNANREYVHHCVFESEDEACALKARIERAPDDWTPVNSEFWYSRTIYGSAAWSQADEDALSVLD